MDNLIARYNEALHTGDWFAYYKALENDNA